MERESGLRWEGVVKSLPTFVVAAICLSSGGIQERLRPRLPGLLVWATALLCASAACAADRQARSAGSEGAVIILVSLAPLLGCTAFLVSDHENVLAANNEDSSNPDTKIWFVPRDAEGRLGRVYLGYGNLWPQGGMNEEGLFFDGFGLAPMTAREPDGKPKATFLHILESMERFSTVEEVVGLFEQHDRSFMDSFMLVFADATGDAVIIERDALLRRNDGLIITSHLQQSRLAPDEEPGCQRYRIACQMIASMPEVSVHNCRRVLSAVHFEGESTTQYSNICDLRNRRLHLYHFHDFEHALVFDLATELDRDARVLSLREQFPSTFAAESYWQQREAEIQEQLQLLPGNVDRDNYSRYTGEYSEDHAAIPGLVRTVKERDGHLYTHTNFAPGEFELHPKSGHTFVQLDHAGRTEIEFIVGESGPAEGVTINGRTAVRLVD